MLGRLILVILLFSLNAFSVENLCAEIIAELPDATAILNSPSKDFVRMRARHRPAIDSLNAQFDHSLSIYPFANLSTWEPLLLPKIARTGDNVLVLLDGSRPKDRNTFIEPIGGTPKERAKTIEEILTEHPTWKGKPNTFLHVSEEVADHLRGSPNLIVREVAEKSEYIYEIRNLATLEGKELRAQRQGVARFYTMFPEKGDHPRSQYTEFNKLSDSDWKAMVPRLRDFLKLWSVDRHGSERYDFTEELRGARRMIIGLKPLGFDGGALQIDGKIAAFIVGKPMNSNTTVIYVEKALTNLNGEKIDAYKAVSQKFSMATIKDSLRANDTPTSKKALEQIRDLESLEGLGGLSHDEQVALLSKSELLNPTNIDKLMPLNLALRQSRGLGLKKALLNPGAMSVWEALKLRDLSSKIKNNQPIDSALEAAKDLKRAQVHAALESIPNPFIKYINRQEDGGEALHKIPKKQYHPIPALGKNYSVQSSAIPELIWNVYESDQ